MAGGEGGATGDKHASGAGGREDSQPVSSPCRGPQLPARGGGLCFGWAASACGLEELLFPWGLAPCSRLPCVPCPPLGGAGEDSRGAASGRRGGRETGPMVGGGQAVGGQRRHLGFIPSAKAAPGCVLS